MHFPRRALALLALAVAALASGCTAVSEYAVTQDGLGAPVTMSITLCPSDGSSGSEPTTCTNGAMTEAVGKQLLMGWIVPKAATVSSVTITGAPEGTKLTENASWTAWLNSWYTVRSDMKWVGYASNRVATAPVGKVKVAAAFDMPGANGATPVGTTTANMAVFSRAVADDAAAATPVNCSNACENVHRFRGAAFEMGVPLRDVAITGLDLPIAVDPGTEVTLPFTITYAGDAGSGTLTPTAETTIPGATITGGEPTSFASSGTKSLPLKLSVPASPGVGGEQTLKVTLKLPSGGTRATTVRLRLPELPKPAPVVEQPKPTPPPVPDPPVQQPRVDPPVVVPSLSLVAGKVSGAKLKSGLTLKQAFPSAGTATVEVKLGAKRLARTTTTVAGAGTRTLPLKWSAAGRKALKGRRSAKVKVLVSFADAAGHTATRTVLATVR